MCSSWPLLLLLFNLTIFSPSLRARALPRYQFTDLPMASDLLPSLGFNILLGSDGLLDLVFPKIIYLNLLYFLPCSSLLMISPHLSSVGQCSVDICTAFILYFTENYQMLMCLFLFLIYVFAFFSNIIALMLSLYILYPPTWYPWASQKHLFHNRFIITSFLPTTYVSVEIFLLIFFCGT